ncbi:trypsin-like peptidase domain-containing protein [Rhizobium sp. CIAT894]|uniref:trypsin-like serine peptidase n=1 Tax=Rhizobium sp. CIAT894 TaxID=2020312 RepID=UPI000A1DC8D6|nr:serine protease [Rhizobium sp. CIAT894]ARM89705.1 trypsin-like peptidase domain-containing protein [Rhizobium sp. CIAT894]
MFVKICVVIAAVIGLVGECYGAELCAVEKLPLTTFGEHATLSYTLNGTSPEKTFPVKLTGAEIRYTRLLISAPSQGSYDIEIRDFTGKVLQSIGPNSVVHSQSNPTPGAVAFWSNRLPAAILKVEVAGLSANQDVKLLEYEAMPAGAKAPFYSVKGNEPYWFDAYSSSFDDAIKAEADSVGMLVTSEGSSYSGFRNWCCSGSIVSTKPRLLFMTNFHCGGTAGAVEDYWSDDVCHHTIVDFSWDGDTVGREYQCVNVPVKEKSLDLAVLELAPLVPGTPPPPAVFFTAAEIRDGQNIHVIHHPQCLQKQVSVACTVTKSKADDWLNAGLMSDFEHDCNTEGGSSGAPVFDDDGEVIGLHHLPYHETSPGLCQRANAAVSINPVISVLKSISPTPVLDVR